MEGRLIALHNFSSDPKTVRFSIGATEPGTQLIDLLIEGDTIEPEPSGDVEIQLDGYGHLWLRVLLPGGTRLG
jgi:hypothetical protein